MEARIAPLADPAAAVQVSARGGSPIRWSADSARLYYADGDTLAGVDVGPQVMISGCVILSDVIVIERALAPGTGR